MINKVRIFLTLILMALAGCQSEYDAYVERELATGVKNDSLILGMYIGQTQKEFYSHCWELNAQKVISQGTGNQTARYTEPYDSINPNPKRKDLLFYGIFDEDKVMQGMDMTYSYTGWAPWSEQHVNDTLVAEIKEQVMNDYGGNPFIKIDLKSLKKEAWVKIDGNRQFLVFPKNDKDVVVKIEDLPAKLGSE